MYSSILSARVHQLKETEKGVTAMCRELEEIYSEGEQKGELKKARIQIINIAVIYFFIDNFLSSCKLIHLRTISHFFSHFKIFIRRKFK